MKRVAIALLASACGSDVETSPPAGTPWFVEEAAVRGLRFEHVSGQADTFYMPEIMTGGAALFDADQDGDLDAYLVQGGQIIARDDRTPPSNSLFENDGTGHFEDRTEASGTRDAGYGMGVACADIDGDGRVDLYVTNFGPNVLFRNRGGLRFQRATDTALEHAAAHAGWSTSAGFFDADRDGDLDLYVCNYLNWTTRSELPCKNNSSMPDYCSPRVYESPANDAYYENSGDGTFADRSAESGIGASFGTGLGLGCGDFDDDGWIDVFVANDGMDDFLWTNLGDGRFRDDAALAGCAVDMNGIKKAGMGVALGDLDHDLDLDIVVCNLSRESDSLYLNVGGHFLDRTSRAGLAVTSKAYTRFGLGLLDFDADSMLDLYQANGRVSRQSKPLTDDPYAEDNLVFRSRNEDGHVVFEEVLPRGGVATPVRATSRAAAFGDVDGDAFPDVLVVNRDGPAHLFLNRVARRGAWVQVALLEAGGGPAEGAQLEGEIAGRPFVSSARAAYSYQASNDPRLFLGLDTATGVDEPVVTWSDGTREAFDALAAGSRASLRRGTGRSLPAAGKDER